MSRKITMSEAMSEAIILAMEADASVILIGEGVKDNKGIFGTTIDTNQKFNSRVFESPLSEDAVTGICAGLALTGGRPILIHQRIEFMMLTMNQLVNNISKWRFLFGGEAGHLPLVIRVIVGRGFGQSAQHSQSLQALVAHIPGLVVVMPATAKSAKGLFLASVNSDNPVIFIEHRWCHSEIEYVPPQYYTLPLGQARVVNEGSDVTLVSYAYMLHEALKILPVFKSRGVSVELIDLQTLNPLDFKSIIKSVKKTGRLIVADLGWYNCGIAPTVAAYIAEHAFSYLKAPIKTITLPNTPTPCSWSLEEKYYPSQHDLAEKITEILGMPVTEGTALAQKKFDGPF